MTSLASPTRLCRGAVPVVLVTALTLLTFLLPAPAPAQGSPSAVPAATPTIQWSPCAPAASVTAAMDCAEFPVPLDDAWPSGPEIRIHVLRVRATGSPSERIGSLFVNPGGPGGSGAEFAAVSDAFLSPALLRHFDIVGFDPRGIAGSRPALDCPAVIAPSPSIGWPAYFSQTAAVEQPVQTACAIATARTRDHVGTNDVVADLDRLRAAVGDAQLTYWGGSYGTRIGWTYAAMFPGRVRAFILDGNVDPHATTRSFLTDRAGSFDDAFAFFGTVNPAALAEFNAVLTRLGTTSVPVEVDGTTTTVTASLAKELILKSVGGEYLWPQLIAEIHDLKRTIVDGVPTPVETPPPPRNPDELPDDPAPAPTSSNNSATMLRNVNCLDLRGPGAVEPEPSAAATMAQSGPLFSEFMASGLDMCDFLPLRANPIPSQLRGALPPILLIGSVHDPATPYEWSQRMHDALPGSVLLTYEGGQHVAWTGVSPNCVQPAGDNYMINLVLPPLDLRCPYAPS